MCRFIVTTIHCKLVFICLSCTDLLLIDLLSPIFDTEKEKVEGEELQEWLKLVVAPVELTRFIQGKHEDLLQLEAGS